MSSVRIESSAFGDDRFEMLARRAGLADADHARGKMARLWRTCTIEQRHTLSADEIAIVLGDRGVEALVASRLGEQTKAGIRICGTSGRIEWLEKLKENGKKGGRPKKTKRFPSGFENETNLETKRKVSGSEDRNPLTLSPSLSPALVLAPDPGEISEPEPDRPLTGAPRASARSHDTAAPTPVVVEARCTEASQTSLLAPSGPEPTGQDRAKRDRKPVKRRLPVDWAPTAEHAKIASERKLDLSGEVLKLRDWAASRGAAYADWDAMFRNWLRNDQFRSRAPPPQQQYQRPKTGLEALMAMRIDDES